MAAREFDSVLSGACELWLKNDVLHADVLPGGCVGADGRASVSVSLLVRMTFTVHALLCPSAAASATDHFGHGDQQRIDALLLRRRRRAWMRWRRARWMRMLNAVALVVAQSMRRPRCRCCCLILAVYVCVECSGGRVDVTGDVAARSRKRVAS